MSDVAAGRRPRVLLSSTRQVFDRYMREADLDRLAVFADWAFLEFEPAERWADWGPNLDPADIQRFTDGTSQADAVIVCHGSPGVTRPVLEASPRLAFVGDLEGDRFALRIDLEAAWERGVRTVDTTNGS